MRVLIIDDNPDDRELIRRELLRHYPEASVTDIGDRAHLDAVLAEGGFSVVLTDYDLRWGSGIEVFERVKSTCPECPVIMVSGSVGEEAAVDALRRGLDDFVFKTPRGPRGVAAAIRRVLDRQRQRAELQEAENRYRNLFLSVPVGLCRCAPDGTFLDGNSALIDMLGLGDGEDELRALSLPDVFDDPGLFDPDWAQAEGGPPIEARLRRRDGTPLWVLLRLRRTEAPDGAEVLEGAITDITERRQAEERLEAAVREKSVLLEELYHRVNNNLQLVLTFVNAQIARTADPVARRGLEDLGARIVSIALVQEQLYRSRNYAEVNLRQYLEELSETLLSGTSIALERRLDDLVVPIGQAIAVGLVANELLLNALKHAFEGVANPVVQLALRRLGGERGELRVEDNGVGIPKGDLAGHERVGYRVIRALVRQADAAIEVGQDGGTRVRLEFPLRT